MKISKMYLNDFIEECKKLGFKVEYNDDTGIYFIPDIDLCIRAWNYKIEIDKNFGNKELNNFLKLYKEAHYYIELEDSNETK